MMCALHGTAEIIMQLLDALDKQDERSWENWKHLIFQEP